MEIVMLFCTVYADFNYAQKAVELQFRLFPEAHLLSGAAGTDRRAVQEAQRAEKRTELPEVWPAMGTVVRRGCTKFLERCSTGNRSGKRPCLRRQKGNCFPYRKEDRFPFVSWHCGKRRNCLHGSGMPFKIWQKRFFGEQKKRPSEAVFRRTDDVWCVVLSQQEGILRTVYPGTLQEDVRLCTVSSLRCAQLLL